MISPVARRYAKALIDLAEDKKALAKVEKDLKSLQSLCESASDFAAFLSHPANSLQTQTDALVEIGKKAKFQDMIVNFMCVAAQHHRLAELPVLVDAALADIAQRRGEIAVHVESASVLSKAQQMALKDQLSKITNKDVVLDVSVNGDLLGGLVVTHGSTRIDDSVAGRLGRLKTAMSGQANENTAHEINKKEA